MSRSATACLTSRASAGSALASRFFLELGKVDSTGTNPAEAAMVVVPAVGTVLVVSVEKVVVVSSVTMLVLVEVEVNVAVIVPVTATRVVVVVVVVV